MNKRFMSLLLVLVMVFSLLPISAMAQVYIFDGKDAIELDFYRNSDDAKPFNTQRVLTSGINAIYDPGCELAENTVFLGWQIDGQGETMDIAGVRNYVTTNVTHLAGKTLKLVASVSPVRYLVYNDESGRVVKTVAVIFARNNNSWATDVDYDYTPANVNSDFFGWKTSQTGTDVEYENKSVEKPTHKTSITLSESTTNLYPVCKSGYWVTFNENDKPYDPNTGKGNSALNENIHATYQPPVFVLDGETLNPNSGKYPVSAQGYEFVEWCDENGNRVTNVTEATTVYAKWTAQTVNYKIAYWKQNANKDENGEYGYSVVADSIYETTGTAGEIATYNKDTARNKYTSEHFTLNDTKSDNEKVIIAGDGSTVKNVYFDRDQFTLRFCNSSYRVKNISGYEISYYKSGSGYSSKTSYAIKIDGKWYQLSGASKDLYNGGQSITSIANSKVTYVYSNGVEYSDVSIGDEITNDDTISTLEDSSNVVKTITAKNGEFIGNNFPITSDDGAVWKPQNGTTFDTNNALVYIDTMPAENITFHKDVWDSSTKYMAFYVEALPGETGQYSFDGKTFDQYGNTIPTRYGYFTEAEDFVDLSTSGYNRYKSVPAFSDGLAEVDSGGTLELYYTRKVHTLSFNTGDSDKPADVTGIKYEEPMASYAPNYVIGETTRDRNGRPIIFQGWYDNSAYTGKAYDFSAKTMPDADVLLFAKWADARYAVQLQLDGGQMPEGSQTEFKVSYNGTVDITNNPTKAGFEFAGWYTDPACTQRFNLDTQLNEKTVKDAYTDPKDSTVMGKLTLYAKWRQEMDTESYLTVAYDAANGTISGEQTYTDPLHYADQAEAIAQPAAKSAVTGETFAYWEILKPKSATDPTLVPSGVTVYPGAIFNVKMDDALDNTVTLRAHYEASTGTHIIWYGNGGTTANDAETVESADANLNSAIQIKPADTFTREGYEFLGWARLDEDEMKDGDSWKQDDDAAAANLWLKWDGEHYTAVNDKGVTVTDPAIAAKEDLPHHVLYAVWDQTDNHNYVIDFNGKMTIATSATAKKDDSHNNGAFDVAGGNATYQLDYQLSNTETESSTYRADLAFNGIDTAMINGVPVGSAAGTTASWEKYTVIPANNVYFDDSLVGKSMTAGDGSGYNVKVKDYESSPENGQEKTSLVFTFYGTGIDVYCTTDKDAGWIQANVDGTAYPFVNSRYQESEGSTTAIYNTPVISIDGLAPNVEHTLTLRTLTNSNFRLDGIRVYNAMQGVGDEATQAAVNKAYDAADESNAVFLEVRDRILAAGVFSNGAADTDVGDITGAVFLETKAEGATIADYTAKGPKEEAYLAPGQAIAFNLGGWTENTYKVMVGLSMPKSTDSGTATVYASGHGTSNPIKVSARTDMFYEITPDASGNVIIKNNGGGMISVTKLKITTIDPNGTAYEVPAQTTGEPAAEGARGLRVTKSLMAYAMAFDPATEVSPTDNVEEPDTPEEPDDPKPGWNDGAFNPMSILKNLFQNLLDGLGKLFGNLPKW